MKASYEKKQKELGGNDGDLASDKKTLSSSRKKKASDEEFLDKLIPMCKEKAEGYAERKVARAGEEAAIAEAISILNSDDAFASFGKVDATSSGGLGSFLQLRSSHKRISGSRTAATAMLKESAKTANSARLAKVASLLAADNPFATVLDEIDKMLDVIEEEGKQDKENLDWCNEERKDNKKEKKQKEEQMLSLEKEINELDKR